MQDFYKERIPFAEVISDPLLLKGAFDQLSVEQQTLLKSIYGLPLKKEEEKRAWAILQGRAEYDHLGFPTKVFEWPYTPREYNSVWAIIGRRAGKSMLAAFITVYEAIFGGHLQYVMEGQEVTIYYVAQKLDVAAAQLKTVAAFLQQSDLLKDMIEGKPLNDKIVLKNGISIIASSPSLRGQRGLAVPVAILDECGFWYSDPDAANPDVEVENAIRYSQAQFPHYKRIGISTPWTREGLLWKYYQAGTAGEKLIDKSGYEDVLVHFAPTAAMNNPRMTRKAMERLWKEDPVIFQRESLAQFIDAVSGFLPEPLITAALTLGVQRRMPELSKYNYVAAMDPAFRHDAFAFAICHKDEQRRIVLDVILRWKPEKGKRLNPQEVLEEIVPWLSLYGITVVHSDQYQLESLQQLMANLTNSGIAINGMDFTSQRKAKIYGDLETAFKTRQMVLLDPDKSIAMRELKEELVRLEKKNLSSGTVSIAAPDGHYDDLATALALSSHMALRYDIKPIDAVPQKEKSLLQNYLEMLQERKEQLAGGQWD